MNKNITDREDLFWAKMAGRDVDISTMTPPVVASQREELMLEVAERIGAGGGGGSELPTPGNAGNVLTDNGTAWVSAAPSTKDFVVTATLMVDVSTLTFSLSNPDASIADCIAAANDGRNVWLFAKDNVTGITIELQGTLFANFVIFHGATMLGDNFANVDVYYHTVPDDTGPVEVMYLDVLPMLPTVSASDNGLVLGVKDGDYELVDAGHIIGAPLCVTITEDNGSYVTDVTPNELIAALEDKRIVQVHYKVITGQITRYVNYTYEALTVQEGTGYGLTVSIYDSNETTLRKYLTFTSADSDTAFSVSSI